MQLSIHTSIQIKPLVFEMRPFLEKKKKIPIYGSSRTINILKNKYTFCFSERHGYKPIMSANKIKNRFIIKKKNLSYHFAFDVKHGLIKPPICN